MRHIWLRVMMVAALAAPCALQGAVSGLVCTSTSVQAVLRTEGLTERAGEMVFTCTGDTPGGEVGASFSVFLSAPVTNRAGGDGMTDATLTVDAGPGAIPVTVRGRLVGSNAVIFEYVNWPLTSFAVSTIKIANIRVNASGAANRAVTALVSTNGISRIVTNQPNLAVGITQPGLLASSSTTSIVCEGSPLPDEELITLPNLYASGTRVSSLRVTEGATNGFELRQANTTSGTRIIVRYSGFPQGSRLFVPDAIAGTSATEQSSAGDLGVTRALGKYTPGGSGQLLLIRVRGHDAQGAGGSLVWAPPFGAAGPLTLSGASEVPLAGGAGMAVFEVYDSLPSILESAQIPTFLALQRAGGPLTLAQASVSFGPLSEVGMSSPSAPVPRFVAVAAGTDCAALRDCQAEYFPKLLVDSPPLVFTAQAGVPGFLGKYIRILNDQGGTLVWTAKIQYKRGGPEGWLRLSREVGLNNAGIVLDVLAERLPGAGVYEAELAIDAGPVAGSRLLPVTLTATEAPKPIVRPEVTKAYNAAGGERYATLVPGSRAVLEGVRLDAEPVRITVDGVEAHVLSWGQTRAEFVVPEALGFKAAAQLIYSAGFVPSEPFTLALSASAPVIYPKGVLNQDGLPNSPAYPETVGRVFQVFATGLPPGSMGTISAKVHDREIDRPLYAGAAPGLDGIQQVNFAIPGDLPAMSSEVIVCGWPANLPGQRVCSPPFVVVLRRPE